MADSTTILVIDDDRDFKASVRSLLESRGFKVCEAGSGQEGLRMLAECNPDLIVLDIMMECSAEGYGVNQAIKWREEYRAWRYIPIVMVSSIQERPEELFPLAAESDMIRPDYYVSKPLDIPVFLETVRKALERCAKGGSLA